MILRSSQVMVMLLVWGPHSEPLACVEGAGDRACDPQPDGLEFKYLVHCFLALQPLDS